MPLLAELRKDGTPPSGELPAASKLGLAACTWGAWLPRWGCTAHVLCHLALVPLLLAGRHSCCCSGTANNQPCPAPPNRPLLPPEASPKLICPAPTHATTNTTADDWLKGDFDTGKQAELCHQIAVALGFNLDHGRLDVSVHPFTGGDARRRPVPCHPTLQTIATDSCPACAS